MQWLCVFYLRPRKVTRVTLNCVEQTRKIIFQLNFLAEVIQKLRHFLEGWGGRSKNDFGLWGGEGGGPKPPKKG